MELSESTNAPKTPPHADDRRRRMLKSATLADIVLALASRIIPGLLAVLAIPFYLYSLGPDRYAGVGFYLTFQLIIGLLDFGLSASVLREASWLNGQGAPALRFWKLLRTFEIPFWGFAGLVVLAGLTTGETLLRGVFSLDLSPIGLDFPVSALLFASIAFRFPFALYFGYLSGRGHVARANLLVLVFDSIRTIGAVLLLAVLPPSLMLFFAWHTVAALAMSVTGSVVARRSTPATTNPAAVEWSLYKDLRGLAVGSGLLSVLFVSANSIDKIFLPHFLSISDYGYYVAVSQLAVIVFLVVHAIWSAQHPKLLTALSSGNSSNALNIYVLTANLMSAASSAIILAVWLAAPALIGLWARNADKEIFGSVLIVLTVSNAAAAMSHLTLSIQYSAKTMFPMLLVLAVAVFVVPLTVLLGSEGLTAVRGAIAGGGIFVAFLLGGISTYLRHGQPFLNRWWRAVLLPLLATVLLAWVLGRWTHSLPDLGQITIGMAAGALAFVMSVALNRQVRERMRLTMPWIALSEDKAPSG